MRPLEKTYQALKSRLTSGELPTGTRLPSLLEMAVAYGVSRSTLWKVISRLQAENLVHTRPRGVITAGPPTSEAPPFLPGGSTWERLKAQMGREILGKAFPSSVLPAVSKLALHYGVAVNTLKKVLVALAREGLLRREGRRFIITQGHGAGGATSMVLVFRTDKKESSASIADPRTEQLVLAFERECRHSDIVSLCEGFEPDRANGLLDITVVIRRMNNVSGFIVPLWNPGNAAQWQRWIDLLTFLTDRLVPVVVIDLDGNLSFPVELVRKKKFRVLQIAGKRAGEMVAETLLRSGHHRLAFITPSGDSSWARRRYEGVVAYCRQYGADTTAEIGRASCRERVLSCV
jgi:DNA-binding FadR family transcriptional regulator